jgi:hypothetical protein
MSLDELRDLKESKQPKAYAAPEVIAGMPVPAVRRIELLSSEEWEEFIEEWAHSLKEDYPQVKRYGGSGDKGCDVLCFTDDQKEHGVWDNYQCKHYDHPLSPSEVWLEMGKAIYYSFSGEYSPPRKYYFVAPKGIGTALSKLLGKPEEIKKGLMEKWIKYCKTGITQTEVIPLEGDLQIYLDKFDFSIFDSKSVADLIEGHSKTPFFTTRFGGGLPERPPAEEPPETIQLKESRYIQQLLEAYSDYLSIEVKELESLVKWPELEGHLKRSRETFYHAESLRNFARDTVPEGTYEDLQEEVFSGVVDTCESAHDDGLARVRSTVSKAGEISLTSNALVSRIRIQDKHGICHQLANEDRLIWVKK